MLSFGLWPFEARSQDLSDLFSKISTLSKDAGNAIKVVFFIAGICFIGMGIMKLIQAADRREPKGPGLTYIFLGFLLLGVYSLAKAGSPFLSLFMRQRLPAPPHVNHTSLCLLLPIEIVVHNPFQRKFRFQSLQTKFYLLLYL